jgi:MFS family permease
MAGYLGMAWGVSAFVMGYLADKVGRRAVLAPAILVFSLMSAFSGLAGSVVALVFVRVIMGIAEGPVASTGVAVAVEASKPERRGMNNGVFQCMISLFGLALGPVIATRLLDSHSWHTVFMLVGLPGVVMAILMWAVVREPAKRADTGHGTGGAPFLSLFAHRNAKVAPLTLICAMGGIFVIAAMLTAYLTAPIGAGLGLDPITAGNVFSAVGVGGAIGQFAMPALSDFIGRKLSTLASYILAAVALYFFTQAGPENTTTLWTLLFFASLFNFAALAILAGPVAAEAAPPGMLASMAGFVIFAGEFVGGGISPIIAGNLAGQYGLKAALYFAACGLVLGFIVALFLEETAPRRVKA